MSIKDFIETKLQNVVRRSLLDWPMDFGVETAVLNGVDGDYHEFGVYRGRSFIRNGRRFLALLDPARRAAIKFWAYDSFEGLPQTKDRFAPGHYGKGDYAAGEDLFLRNVTGAGIDRARIETVAGFYDASLTPEIAMRAFGARKIAMTYIDCDIYESAVPIFRFITSGLQVGSVIVIDDWVRHHMHPDHGMQRAFHEWLKDNPSIKLSPIALSKRIAFVVYKV